MLNLKNILVPRDYSECSEQALTYALDLSLRTGAAIHTVFAEVLHAETKQPPPDTRREREELLERLRALNTSQTFIKDPVEIEISSVVVRDIAPAPAILSYSDEHDIDMIVMGTHGRRGLRRLLLGSVTEEVVRLSTCPVYTIRCREDQEELHIPARVLLVPVDFSSRSMEALRHAKELALLYDAEIVLLHIIEDRLHPAFYNMGVFSVYDVQPDIEEKARLHIKEFNEKAGLPEVRVSYEVRPGHAADGIIRYAKEHNVDQIIMATHGLTGLEHFLIGSVAEKVVRGAPCPVLTIKTHEKLLVGDADSGASAAVKP